jgi:hypothetical protein
MELADADHHLGTGFFVYKRIISAVRRVEFVSNSDISFNLHNWSGVI